MDFGYTLVMLDKLPNGRYPDMHRGIMRSVKETSLLFNIMISCYDSFQVLTGV